MSKYSDMLPNPSAPSGTWVGQLSAEQLADLADFVGSLSGMTAGSRASYRSYMAEVMVRFDRGETLESSPRRHHLRSALRKYEEYAG